MTSRIAALALLVVALPAAALAVTNGGFSPASPIGSYVALPGGSTAIPGWVTTDTGVEWFEPVPFSVTASPDGGHVVDLANTSFAAGGIRQTFATEPGVMYLIEFQCATQQSAGRDGTAEIVVTVDGVTETVTLVNHSSIAAWETRTVVFTADDASATLHFRCLQNANEHFAFLDGVALHTPLLARSYTWARIKEMFRSAGRRPSGF